MNKTYNRFQTSYQSNIESNIQWVQIQFELRHHPEPVVGFCGDPIVVDIFIKENIPVIVVYIAVHF